MAAAGAGGGAAAGVGGGAPAAVPAASNLEDRISNFLALIHFSGRNKADTFAEDDRDLFLGIMAAVDPVFPAPAALRVRMVTDVEKKLLYTYLPELVSKEKDGVKDSFKDSLVNIGGPNAQGKYGLIKHDPSVPGRLWKVVRKTEQLDITNTAFVVIKESFIQYILSTDRLYGNSVPKIYGIYRAADDSAIYIEMERGNETLISVQEKSQYQIGEPGHQQWVIGFMPFAEYLKSALIALKYFHDTYNFTHRDLKLNNVIVSADRRRALLIDFGMSCITLTVDDVDYTIRGGGTVYIQTIPCVEQQDMGMLLMDMLGNSASYDPHLLAFMDAALPASMNPYTEGTALHSRIARMGGPYVASHNYDGTFYPSLSAADRAELQISTILRKLEAIIAAAKAEGLEGGRRRHRRRRFVVHTAKQHGRRTRRRRSISAKRK